MIDDKRVTHIDIIGRSYPLCMTVSANEALADQYGGISGWQAALDQADDRTAISGTVDFLHILLEGGRARMETMARLSNQDAQLPPRLEKQDLKNIITLGDLGDLQAAIIAAFQASNMQTVEVAPEPTKNAETTQ